MSFLISEDLKRLADAVEDAEISFWATIADKYPEAEHGDFPPELALRLTDEMQYAVANWLTYNADPQADTFKRTVVLLHDIEYFYNDTEQTLTDIDNCSIVDSITAGENEGVFMTPIYTRDDKSEICGKWRIVK